MTNRKQKRTTQAVTLCATVTLLSACATNPTDSNLRGIPLGSSVQLLGAEAEIETKDAKSVGSSVASGAAAGAAGGALMGAGAGAMMGVACGPLLVICSPIGLVGGAAGGVIFGAAAGGITNGMRGLPKDKAEALDFVMASTISEFVEPLTLVNEFTAQSNERWNVVDTGGLTEITLGFEGLFLDQGKDDALTVKIVNSMMIDYGVGELDQTEQILFSFVSERRHVDHWLEDGGANFRAAVREGFGSNIAAMIARLSDASHDRSGE